jgi:hypothetical protein
MTTRYSGWSEKSEKKHGDILKKMSDNYNILWFGKNPQKIFAYAKGE